MAYINLRWDCANSYSLERDKRVLLAVMLISNKLVPFFVLCVIGTSLSSPTEYITEARGIGSTIWGWITYPFTWWSSGSENDNDNKVESTTSIFTHDNNIEIAKHNVTVWCNDQTCTTMKCDKSGCLNLTCNIYDTDMSGVCREYTIKPEDPTQATKPTSQVTEEPKKTTEATSTIETSSLPANTIETSSLPANTIETSSLPANTIETSSLPSNTNIGVEDRPLELEAVLSSTVPINNDDIKIEDATD